MVVLENLPDDLPKEAFAERQFCIEQGLRSHLCIPLSMGKTSPKGAIGFGYMRRRQDLANTMASASPVRWAHLNFCINAQAD